ncbi:MAG: TetR/AcrR family transcriptional regulator [Deltaproteobacteria bacterium]|nr:TetR/AcrR family transcriptional regulator [Deltaproteobacteria bacterium]
MEHNPRHLPADERRAVTIEAVVELAAEQNPSEITTASIAKRMKLTQGALFRHFPSKKAIWKAVMEWVAERLLARTDKAEQTAPTPLAALESVFMAHIDFIARHPGVPRMIFGELQSASDTPAKLMVRTLIDNYKKRLQALIEKGKSRGDLALEVDSAAAATLFIGTVQGLVIQSMLDGGVKRLRAEAPAVFAIYMRGIRSAP